MATPAALPTLISSSADLAAFLSSLNPSDTLYLDLEGKNLSRNGTVCLMTVLAHPTNIPRVIDIQTLEHSAFTTPGADGKTLQTFLEDPHTPKCLWDVRNDADALWAHYGVRLAGVTDVQLLENASRAGDKTYVRGLDICVDKDLGLSWMERTRWLRTKREVRDQMPNDVFARRPLDVSTVQYCVNDVVHLPALRDLYAVRIGSQWMEKVMEESARRVAGACDPSYEPQSEAKKLGPWGSGEEERGLTMDEWLERVEDARMDAMQEEYLGYDDYDELDPWNDDFGKCSKDAAFDDTFDSCWEKN